jgi:two-component system nitrogen regulation response regulator NtrX
VLRAIQEQKIEHLGGEKTIDLDVRILAATNKDLEKACAEGSFRQDLFFRLNVIPIRLPPLRERKSDIPLLLFHFLGELGSGKIEFEAEALEILNAYSWPGNIRELKNFAERIAVMYAGGKVGAEAASGFLKKDTLEQVHGQAPEQSATEGLPHKAMLPDDLLDKNFNTAKEFFEKYYLEFQLFKNHGIISKTAEAIGIYPSNLHAKLKKYGIAFPANKD